MLRIFLFMILSVPVVFVSRKALFNFKSHGFYRFLSWECILWLLATNYPYWFMHPFSVFQIISWILLLISIYLVLAGIMEMKKAGKADKTRTEKELYGFERTTELVDTGIFRFIRHPLYSSLIFVTWGIFFKNPDTETIIVAALSSIFLLLTALYDEKECVVYFGEKYVAYMKRSKRFVPFIF